MQIKIIIIYFINLFLTNLSKKFNLITKKFHIFFMNKYFIFIDSK